MNGFLFATGIENSYPTVAGGRRVDEMEVCGHYARWRDDLQLTHDLGIDNLRIGPAYYLIHEAPGRYRWDLFDEIIQEMQRLGIEPFVDLLHFGVPDWMGNFQNTEFPELFAEYSASFARRYPHVRYYTPVNEILIAARFSAQYGWWNECMTDDRSYVTALTNLIKANLLSMHSIRRVRPDAVFIQTESFEYWHAGTPEMQARAELENQIRFIPLDLTYGVNPGPLAWDFLRYNGLSEKDIDLFHTLSTTDSCVIGIDYYITSEHVLLPEGQEAPVSDTLGLVELAREYHSRYGLPLMHTETNMASELAVDWLRKQWMGVLRLLNSGVPVIGFTWFSLTDQMDWDKALRDPRGHICEIGLADLDRKLRPVGHYYREIIKQWKGRMPGSTIAVEMDIIKSSRP